jgi:hypothetical protein
MKLLDPVRQHTQPASYFQGGGGVSVCAETSVAEGQPPQVVTAGIRRFPKSDANEKRETTCELNCDAEV